MIFKYNLQGDNAKFIIFLRQNGLPFDVFDVIPTSGQGETSVLIRVKNVALLDTAQTKTISFSVRSALNFSVTRWLLLDYFITTCTYEAAGLLHSFVIAKTKGPTFITPLP